MEKYALIYIHVDYNECDSTRTVRRGTGVSSNGDREGWKRVLFFVESFLCDGKNKKKNKNKNIYKKSFKAEIERTPLCFQYTRST